MGLISTAESWCHVWFRSKAEASWDQSRGGGWWDRWGANKSAYYVIIYIMLYTLYIYMYVIVCMIHMVLVQLYRHTGLTQSKCIYRGFHYVLERPVHTYVLKRPGQLHRNVVQEASSLAGLEAREASWRFGASNLVTSMLEPEVIGYGKMVERCRTIFSCWFCVRKLMVQVLQSHHAAKSSFIAFSWAQLQCACVLLRFSIFQSKRDGRGDEFVGFGWGTWHQTRIPTRTGRQREWTNQTGEYVMICFSVLGPHHVYKVFAGRPPGAQILQSWDHDKPLITDDVLIKIGLHLPFLHPEITICIHFSGFPFKVRWKTLTLWTGPWSFSTTIPDATLLHGTTAGMGAVSRHLQTYGKIGFWADLGDFVIWTVENFDPLWFREFLMIFWVPVEQMTSEAGYKAPSLGFMVSTGTASLEIGCMTGLWRNQELKRAEVCLSSSADFKKWNVSISPSIFEWPELVPWFPTISYDFP